MSVENKETEIFEEEVVNESETMELVETDKEVKKAEMKTKAKKVLKIAGVAAVGLLGYLLGTKASSKCECYESEVVDVETVDSDEE